MRVDDDQGGTIPVLLAPGADGYEEQQASLRAECRAMVAEGAAGRTKVYEIGKAAKTGSEIVCPWCGETHTKTTYQKVFCSNGKVDRTKNCKDKFWNTATVERRGRTESMGGFDHSRRYY